MALLYSFSFAGSIINCLLAPVILNYFGPRKMMIIAGIGSSTGYLFKKSNWSYNMPKLYVYINNQYKSISWAAGSLAGDLVYVHLCLGLSLPYFANMFFFCSNVVFQSWMDKKRVFGNATVFCGIPAGTLILGPFWKC